MTHFRMGKRVPHWNSHNKRIDKCKSLQSFSLLPWFSRSIQFCRSFLLFERTFALYFASDIPLCSLQHWRVLQVPYCIPVFQLYHTYQYHLGHVLSQCYQSRYIPLRRRRHSYPRSFLAKRLLLPRFLSDLTAPKVVELHRFRQPSAHHRRIQYPSFPITLPRWPHLLCHL
jgi:hypothetical protein